MAFLDNSGDIILDAVLSDHGRKLLAEGDGSFQITKFGLADDEIDYSLYNKNHPSGSSYYDLEILQTPMLEAFTDNAAMLKYNLTTYSNLELLFLPVLRLNETNSDYQRDANKNVFIVCANSETEDNGTSTTTFTAVGVDSQGNDRTGFLFGATPSVGGAIMVDEGLDTTLVAPTRNLEFELVEETYTIQMDSRLGQLTTESGTPQQADYIDDDSIAYYTVTKNQGFVSDINSNTATNQGQVIRGPRGTRIIFKIQASLDLQTSSYLFTQLGGTDSMANREAGGAGTSSVYFIDTTVKVTGQKTGVTIDVPIRYVRLA